MPRGTVLGNMLAGFTAVALCFWIVSVPDLGSGGVCIVAFFAFTIFRLSPLQALVAVIPYGAFNQLLLVEALRAGTLSFGTVVLSSTLAVEALLSGLLACVTIDRITREGYRQERIVAMQGEIIDRLHKAEVQRQVAERSRGLSEALARLTETPRTPTRLAPGDVVEERYRIVRTIGSGGMGQVHEVERLTDRRRLALKTLTTVADRQALARFAREAQVAAELDHRNVVAALDIGVTPSGTPFLVMDLVLGSSLAGERSRFGDARWALPILTQIAKALSAMHAHGIVHRDLKPSNVLLDGDLVKVADFGLAGLLVEHAPLAMTRPPNEDSPALTLTGAIMGTPLYMAPELVRGVREAGPPVDLFSFGVVAYELLSTKLPYAVPPVLERLSGRHPAPPVPLTQSSPHLHAQLCTLVDGCLALAPEARPTAEAVAAALETL
jgi:serine/threonine-protein kinase